MAFENPKQNFQWKLTVYCVSSRLFCYFSLVVTEWGDDVRPISEEEAMVIVNHQSTGDVCTLMMCLQDKGTVRPVQSQWLRP